jgi:hypothetical protein
MLSKEDFEGALPAILIQGEHQTCKIDSGIQFARDSIVPGQLNAADFFGSIGH